LLFFSRCSLRVFQNTLMLLDKMNKLDDVRQRVKSKGSQTWKKMQQELAETRKKLARVTNPQYKDAYESKIETLEKKLEQIDAIDGNLEEMIVKLNKGKLLLEETTLEFINVGGISSKMDNTIRRWESTMEVALKYQEDFNMDVDDSVGDLDEPEIGEKEGSMDRVNN
ncbi:hypothetical protein ACFL35_19305, partial [Candidatus Riflebacteria bacterium]